MLRIVCLCIPIFVGVLLIINAVFMLTSPRVWFRLPGSIGAKGTLTEQKYGSGWGAAQVRIAGAVMLAVIVWILYDFFIRRG